MSQSWWTAFDELARVPARDTLIKLPVGDHETLQTLLERVAGDSLAAALAAEYEGRPNILLSKGMAQDPRIGALLARDLVRRGELEGVARRVMTLLMISANGTLSHVEVVEVNSNAGGMGAGGGPEIGQFLATHIERFSRATVKYTMIRIGALTYLPVAPRAAANARLATRANLARLGKQRTERRILDVELAELPLRGEDGQALGAEYDSRSWLASTLFQARRSPEVTALLDAREVNHRVGEFGEFRRIAAGWSRPIHSSVLVREGAAYYLRAIRELPAHWSRYPAADSVMEITVIPGDLDLSSIEQVLQELKTQPLGDGPVLTRLLTETQNVPSTGVVLRTDANEIDMDGLACRFARGEVKEEYMGGLMNSLRRKLGQSREDLSRARARCELSRQSVRTSLAASRNKPLSAWSKMWRKFESTRDTARRNAKSLRALEPALRSLCLDFAVVARCSASISILEKAIEIIERAAGSKFEILSAALARMADLGTPPTGFARYAPFDDVTAKLEKAAAQSDQALHDALMGCVQSISLAGVAAMFDVTPEVASIVTAMQESRFAWIAPLWGGASTFSEPRHRIVVMPPMSDSDFDVLRREAERRIFRPLLRRTASAAAGCAVVSLDFYPVEEYEHILPAFYESQPEIVCEKPQALHSAEIAA